MKTFKEFISESSIDLVKLGIFLLNYNESKLNDLKIWISNLRTSGRAPSGMKKEFEDILWLKKQIESPLVAHDNIKATFSWWTKDDIKKIVDKLSKVEGETEELTIGDFKFINKGNDSFKKFKSNSEYVASELSKVKGFHKDALKGGLTIVFVKKALCKSKAAYKSMLDELWLRSDRFEKGDGYASLIYVVMHELGHRYEKKVKSLIHLPFTTKYSQTESLSGDEAFAELFALSYWPKKYSEYKSQINDFVRLIKK